MAKLVPSVLVMAGLLYTGSAVAAERCDGSLGSSPGEVNQAIKEIAGTPGKPDDTDLSPAEFAHLRNSIRKEVCPPPGQAKKPAELP